MGSDAHTRLAGQTHFLDFPKCEDLKALGSHLDSWYKLMETVRAGDDEEMKRALLMKGMPERMKQDILRRQDLDAMPIFDLIESMKTQISWTRLEILARQIATSQEHALPIASLGDAQKPTQPGNAIEVLAKHGVPQAVVDALVAALKPPAPPRQPSQQRPQRRTRSPRPREVGPLVARFNGCHHCGEPGHSRVARGQWKGCAKYAKLIADNDIRFEPK